MPEVNRDTSATIGTSSVIVAEDLWENDRVEITLTNISSGGQVISIAIDGEAVANTGKVLSPGGFYAASEGDGFKPTKKRISAISSAAGGILAISERIRVR